MFVVVFRLMDGDWFSQVLLLHFFVEVTVIDEANDLTTFRAVTENNDRKPGKDVDNVLLCRFPTLCIIGAS